MGNIWSNSFAAFALAALAAAGLSAIVFGIYYFWVTKTGSKRKLKDSEATVIISVFFFIGLVVSMFLVNQLTNDSEKSYKLEQYSNCSNSTTSDGQELTESQCKYFQDVLNGKYVNR